jgi:DNA-binding MarR family transcriptional regulator
LIERVVADHDVLMHRLAEGHAPEFLEIPVSMPQAKVLYLVSAEGGLHMSTLAQRLGVTLSTVSGLVDRLVEHGLATRRADPADRRQVVVGLTPEGDSLIQRFRELNHRQLRLLLVDLPDADLAVIDRAFELLTGAAAGRRTDAAAAAASQERNPA